MLARGTSHRKLPIKGFFIEPRKKGLELIGRRWGQDEANEAQSGEEETKTRPRRAKFGPRRAKIGSRRAKMGPRWAKSGLSWTSRGEIGQRSGRNRAEVAGRIDNGRSLGAGTWFRRWFRRSKMPPRCRGGDPKVDRENAIVRFEGTE